MEELDEEFGEIIDNLKVTPYQIHLYYLKVLIIQYKKVYRCRALGGEDCGNYYHASL